MLFKFTGEYTHGRTSITVAPDVVFHGTDPCEVPDEMTDLVRRLSGHPEFEAVDPLDHDGDGEKGGSLPKPRRGRPKKTAA